MKITNYVENYLKSLSTKSVLWASLSLESQCFTGKIIFIKWEISVMNICQNSLLLSLKNGSRNFLEIIIFFLPYLLE